MFGVLNLRKIVVNYNVQFILKITECANIKLPSLHTFIVFAT
jgi:hypothetical protein